MNISTSMRFNDHLYLRNNVTLFNYETKINKLISGKTEEKKISILEGIKNHTDKILKTESGKYDNAEMELNKNQNHLNVVANGNFTLAERVEYLYRMYHNNKPLSEFDKTDISIRSEVLQTNIPSSNSKAPADIEIMKRLVIKTTKILKARQEVLKKEMKESARRINICNDAISFCDSKIAYLQTQIRNRKSAAQQKLNNAGKKVGSKKTGKAGKKKKSASGKAQAAKYTLYMEGVGKIEYGSSPNKITSAKEASFDLEEDGYGLFVREGNMKVYGKVGENDEFIPNGKVVEES